MINIFLEKLFPVSEQDVVMQYKMKQEHERDTQSMSKKVIISGTKGESLLTLIPSTEEGLQEPRSPSFLYSKILVIVKRPTVDSSFSSCHKQLLFDEDMIFSSSPLEFTSCGSFSHHRLFPLFILPLMTAPDWKTEGRKTWNHVHDVQKKRKQDLVHGEETKHDSESEDQEREEEGGRRRGMAAGTSNSLNSKAVYSSSCHHHHQHEI